MAGPQARDCAGVERRHGTVGGARHTARRPWSAVWAGAQNDERKEVGRTGPVWYPGKGEGGQALFRPDRPVSLDYFFSRTLAKMAKTNTITEKASKSSIRLTSLLRASVRHQEAPCARRGLWLF